MLRIAILKESNFEIFMNNERIKIARKNCCSLQFMNIPNVPERFMNELVFCFAFSLLRNVLPIRDFFFSKGPLLDTNCNNV